MGLSSRVVTGRAYHFRAVHMLTGGPYPEGLHGHAYRVEVLVDGTDVVPALDEIFARDVRPLVHGRMLDGRVGPGGPATGETLVEWIDEVLRRSPLGPRLRAVLLHETAKNRFASARTEDRYV